MQEEVPVLLLTKTPVDSTVNGVPLRVTVLGLVEAG